MKIIAPAKVNLFLGIGARRADGYHEAHTVLHALTLHDTLHLHKKTALDSSHGTNEPLVQLVTPAGVDVPAIPSADNLAAKAIKQLETELRYIQGVDATSATPENDCFTLPCDFSDVVVRIEKNIPAQAGLGGASSDAAAALVGAAALHGIARDHPALDRAARALGADVAFFLRGGCAYFTGTGEHFVHALTPSTCALALIKPAGGVSTPAAYQRFDQDPRPVDTDLLQAATRATCADDVPLFNNLAPASEALMPALAHVRTWADTQPGVVQVLLCGSGATTFALCENAAAAFAVVAQARRQGWWARTTHFCALGATIAEDAPDTADTADAQNTQNAQDTQVAQTAQSAQDVYASKLSPV